MTTSPLPAKPAVKAFGSDTKAPGTRETSLSVRLEGGDAWGFPYAYLVNMSFQSVTGVLTLTYSSHKVTIEGKALNALYEALLMQSIQFVQVTTGHNEVPEGETDILSIRVEEQEG